MVEVMKVSYCKKKSRNLEIIFFSGWVYWADSHETSQEKVNKASKGKEFQNEVKTQERYIMSLDICLDITYIKKILRIN